MSVCNGKCRKERQLNEMLRRLRAADATAHRDGRVCFFVCMHFNITVVLCFAPSLFLRNCRTVRALATPSLSDLWVWSHGREQLSPHPELPVTSSVTTPFRPSRLSKLKWGLIIIEGRGLSARLPPCTQQRKVQHKWFFKWPVITARTCMTLEQY